MNQNTKSLDFYAIERFGKTHLGTLMHYAKQGQNKLLMKRIAEEIKQKKIATKITGLAITGSFKGFDVISEL